jgi:K+-sensing histidine kinase KdpD
MPKELDILLISVSDNGIGLPDDKMDQIFNSFFTTKPILKLINCSGSLGYLSMSNVLSFVWFACRPIAPHW